MFVEASKVPAPLIGVVVADKLKVGVLEPCVKFPVKVSVPAIVTVLLLLLVNVVEAAGVTDPPKVMAELPAID